MLVGGSVWCWGELGAEGEPHAKRRVSSAVLGRQNVVPGGSQCWGGGAWCNTREGTSLVLDPVLRWGSSGLGAWCGAGRHWEGAWCGAGGAAVGVQGTVLAEKPPSTRGGDSVGLGQTGQQPSSPSQIALSHAGEPRGARQGRASSLSLGLCCRLLLSKAWLCPSCSSTGTLWEAGKQAGPLRHPLPET